MNARDAMPSGGALTVSASQGRREGSQADSGMHIRLAVTDTGTGMDEATRAQAVEPFFSTMGVGKSTGLGPSMVHGLAAQLAGGLWIDSTSGRRTMVALRLPGSAGPATADLIVTDHVMPGMSGAEFAQAAQALRPGLPVLIVSGYAEEDEIAPDLPGLRKPFRAMEWAERVTALLPPSSHRLNLPEQEASHG